MYFMKLKYRKFLITILLIIEIFMVNLTYQSFLHKEINKEENKITNKQFAMFIKENDKYVEYKGDSVFPKGYYVNKSLSKCVDENDNPVENAISSLGNSVTITSNKTIYCTLYFDKNEILEYLRNKDTKGALSEDIAIDMYRYQGIYAKDENENVTNDVENYICLGDDCTEYGKDLYRIIGVTETGELKVIKKIPSLLSYSWHVNRLDDVDWPDSNLFHMLNGSTGNYLFYNELDSSLQEKIVIHTWHYNKIFTTSYDAKEMYNIEMNGSKTVNAYVGLLHLYDYLLSYSTNGPNDNEEASTSWLFLGNNQLEQEKAYANYEWTLERYPCDSEKCFAYDITSNGDFMMNGLTNNYAGRPVFYLSSDILITGEGTLAEPFKIGLEDENGNETFEYPFKGNYETFTVFKDGTYKIELWGASGNENYNSRVDSAGRGAYTKGSIELKKDDKLYVYVGENYNGIDHAKFIFNGGGPGESPGGGATDVRLENGEWDNFNGLKSRIMVAAGGGGSVYLYYIDENADNQRGDGGTLNGIDAHWLCDASFNYSGHGAGQTSGGEPGEAFKSALDPVKTATMVGKFGQGGYSQSARDSSIYYTSSGGGGGYYGGGHGNHPGGSWSGGGGGSSYISGYEGCKAITKESTESNINHSDSPDHYSGKVFSDSVMIAGNDTMPNYNGGTMVGNTGNGYARITKIK